MHAREFVLTGVLFLLVALVVLSQADAAWWSVVSIIVTFSAAVAFFARGWAEWRRARQ